MMELEERGQQSLRAMLAARREFDAADEACRKAWQKFLAAQGEFTGYWCKEDYPLGPFVVGDILIEHEPENSKSDKWPPDCNVFNYKDVIRCRTSD